MATPSTKPGRLLSLDVMRGGTILAMLLVNNPGSWGALYWPLGHADWHGWTPTDLIFPFFLFMVGVAMAYSFAKYAEGREQVSPRVWLRIARRVALLLLLGLLLNGSGKIFGYALAYTDEFDLSTLRWPGVLQRIALAYFGASIIVLTVCEKTQAILAGVLLIGYGAMLGLLPMEVPAEQRLEQESNIVREVDLAVIGKDHMWTRTESRPTDPEGLLSTLPAIVTALAGYWVGSFVRRQQVTVSRAWELVFLGLAIAIGGQLVGTFIQPINKALWTPAFVVLTAGLGTATLGACLLIFDTRGERPTWLEHVGTAFGAVGNNAIFAFVASGFFARLLTVAKVGDQTVKDWFYENAIVGPLASAGISSPEFASLCYAVLFITLWWVILLAMWRVGWTIRV